MLSSTRGPKGGNETCELAVQTGPLQLVLSVGRHQRALPLTGAQAQQLGSVLFVLGCAEQAGAIGGRAKECRTTRA